jgi:hypothetical protein
MTVKGTRSQAPAGHDPHLLEGDEGGGGLEVGVVVDHREPVRGGQDRGQQIRHPDRPVPALAGQFPLGVQRRPPVFVVGRQVLVGRSAIGPESFVINGIARAIERLGVPR